jgi:hypothetical protein
MGEVTSEEKRRKRFSGPENRGERRKEKADLEHASLKLIQVAELIWKIGLQ